MRAFPVANTTVLGRPGADAATWHDEIDHMNPMSGDATFVGQTSRFHPPYGETVCIVESVDGEFGIGLTGLNSLVCPLVNEYLGPMIVGERVDQVSALWAMMVRATEAHLGAGAPTSYAISAIDLAVWDLWGKHEQSPVWQLIGGDASRDPVRCYATGLSVGEHMSQGFNAFKLACPWGADRGASLDQIESLVSATRGLVGDGTPLMLDCWSLNDAEAAIDVLDRLAPYRLEWFEDAVLPTSPTQYARLRLERPEAVLAAGERWYSVETYRQAIDDGLIDIVQPDALWVGGVSATVEIARLAAAGGVRLALHCGANDGFGQHLAFALPANEWAEMYIGSAPDASLMDSYRATPGMALPDSGAIRPTNEPGFGLTVNRSDLEALIGQT